MDHTWLEINNTKALRDSVLEIAKEINEKHEMTDEEIGKLLATKCRRSGLEHATAMIQSVKWMAEQFNKSVKNISDALYKQDSKFKKNIEYKNDCCIVNKKVSYGVCNGAPSQQLVSDLVAETMSVDKKLNMGIINVADGNVFELKPTAA